MSLLPSSNSGLFAEGLNSQTLVNFSSAKQLASYDIDFAPYFLQANYLRDNTFVEYFNSFLLLPVWQLSLSSLYSVLFWCSCSGIFQSSVLQPRHWLLWRSSQWWWSVLGWWHYPFHQPSDSLSTWSIHGRSKFVLVLFLFSANHYWDLCIILISVFLAFWFLKWNLFKYFWVSTYFRDLNCDFL